MGDELLHGDRESRLEVDELSPIGPDRDTRHLLVQHQRQQQARVELNATQRQLLANIQSFYKEAQTARAERDLLRQSFDLASESLRLTTLKYQGGEATVLEVVDAQNTLTDARNAFDEGEARYKVALANLQTVTGTF